MRKIQKRLLPLIPSAHSGPGNETTVKSATLLDSPRANSPVGDVQRRKVALRNRSGFGYSSVPPEGKVEL